MHRTRLLIAFFFSVFLLGTLTPSFGQQKLENNGVCLDPIVGRGTFIDPTHTTGFDLNGASLVDGNLSDYGLLTLTDGASLSIQDSLNYYPAGSEAGFIVSPLGGPLSGDVLYSFEVKTYLGDEIQEAGSPVKVRLLSTASNKYILSFTTTKNFDLVKLYYGGKVIDGLTKLKVYYAFECPPSGLPNCANPAADADGDGYADCYDKCPGGNDAQDADGDGTPDACDTPVTDLSLRKTVDKNKPSLNEAVEFSIILQNDSTFAATGVVVSDPLPAGLTYLSHTAPNGTSYDPATGRWSVGGTLGPRQQLTLRIRARAATPGVTINTAEIIALNETDLDSQPNNQLEGEDDLAHACVSVPVLLAEGDTFTLTAPSGLSSYQWFRNGVPIIGATSASYNVTRIGDYTVNTTSATGCQSGTCCPVSVLPKPCPANVCVPVTIRRLK